MLALGFVAKVSVDLKQTTPTREGGKARSEWGASQAAVDCGRAHENRGRASSTPPDYGSPTPILIATVIDSTQIACVKLRYSSTRVSPDACFYTACAGSKPTWRSTLAWSQ